MSNNHQTKKPVNALKQEKIYGFPSESFEHLMSAILEYGDKYYSNQKDRIVFLKYAKIFAKDMYKIYRKNYCVDQIASMIYKDYTY